MRCPNCGMGVSSRAKKCPECGEEVNRRPLPTDQTETIEARQREISLRTARHECQKFSQVPQGELEADQDFIDRIRRDTTEMVVAINSGRLQKLKE